MAKSYTIKCTKCGAEFVTPCSLTKFCPNCAKANHNDYNREYRKTHKDARKRVRSDEPSVYVPPLRESLTMAQIRARNRRVHVEAGWRGQRCMGGGSVAKMPTGVVA